MSPKELEQKASLCLSSILLLGVPVRKCQDGDSRWEASGEWAAAALRSLNSALVLKANEIYFGWTWSSLKSFQDCYGKRSNGHEVLRRFDSLALCL